MLLVGTVACTSTPTNYVESYRFSSETDTLTSRLREVLLPLAARAEKGRLTVAITGPKITAEKEKMLLDEMKRNLLIDVILEPIEQQQDFYEVALEVKLAAKTCRFNQQKVPLSDSACLLKRNQYLQLVDNATWERGLKYINNDSALATGAVQRLFENRIKIADKQPVTGE